MAADRLDGQLLRRVVVCAQIARLRCLMRRRFIGGRRIASARSPTLMPCGRGRRHGSGSPWDGVPRDGRGVHPLDDPQVVLGDHPPASRADVPAGERGRVHSVPGDRCESMGRFRRRAGAVGITADPIGRASVQAVAGVDDARSEATGATPQAFSTVAVRRADLPQGMAGALARLLAAHLSFRIHGWSPSRLLPVMGWRAKNSATPRATGSGRCMCSRWATPSIVQSSTCGNQAWSSS